VGGENLPPLPGRKGLTVIGLDFSLSAIRVAQQNDPNLNLLISDGEQIAMKEQCADYVTHIGNLEHYQNPELGVQEVARLLKPDGTAIILLPNGFSIAGNVQHVRRTGQVLMMGSRSSATTRARVGRTFWKPTD